MGQRLTIEYIVYEQFSSVLTADISDSAGTVCLISVTDADQAEKGLTVRFPGGRPHGVTECDFDELTKTFNEAACRVREYAGWT